MVSAKRLASTIALGAAFALGACSDSTGPGGVSPANMSTQVLAVSTTLENNPAFQSMLALAPLFPTPMASRMVTTALPSLRTGLAGARMLSGGMVHFAVPRAPGAIDTVVPAKFLGKTIGWSSDSGHYVVTSTPGAPSNGARLLLYAMDTTTFLPVQPLHQIGYLDLTDESAGGSAILGVLLKVGTLTIADYSITATEAVASKSLAVVGFIRSADGTSQVSFDHELTESGNAVSWSASLASGVTTIHFVLNGDTLGNGTEVLQAGDGNNTIEYDVTMSDTTLDGQILFNGTEVATMNATAGTGLTMTGVNGHSLSMADKNHLLMLYVGMHIVALETLLALLGPLFVVAAVSISGIF